MAIKASTHVKYYKNEKGPKIGTLTRKVYSVEGLVCPSFDPACKSDSG